MAPVVKNSGTKPETSGTQVWSLGREDPLEKEMATHSGILAWRIPWTKEWWATVHCHKELGTTEETCMQHMRIKLLLVGPPAGGSRRKGSKPSQQLWNHPKEAFTFPTYKCFPGGSAGKESACDVGDAGSIPGSGRSPGEENGNLLKCSYLGNSMDIGAWRATVYRVQKSCVTNAFTFLT